VESEDNLADILTKTMTKEKFNGFIRRLLFQLNGDKADPIEEETDE
jgi:hypothetical protein